MYSQDQIHDCGEAKALALSRGKNKIPQSIQEGDHSPSLDAYMAQAPPPQRAIRTNSTCLQHVEHGRNAVKTHAKWAQLHRTHPSENMCSWAVILMGVSGDLHQITKKAVLVYPVKHSNAKLCISFACIKSTSKLNLWRKPTVATLVMHLIVTLHWICVPSEKNEHD